MKAFSCIKKIFLIGTIISFICAVFVPGSAWILQGYFKSKIDPSYSKAEVDFAIKAKGVCADITESYIFIQVFLGILFCCLVLYLISFIIKRIKNKTICTPK